MRTRSLETAWTWLVAALAVHVVDEASTGFLTVYNPTVRVLRERFGWFPMPEFSFGIRLAGLVAPVIGLVLLTPLVAHGPRAVRVLAVLFAGLMALNGVGHIVGTIAGRTVATVRFGRPMPGFYSSPNLIATAAHFMVLAWPFGAQLAARR